MLAPVCWINATCAICPYRTPKRDRSTAIAILLILDGLINIGALAFLVVLVILSCHRRDSALLVNRLGDRSAELNSTLDTPGGFSRFGFFALAIMIPPKTAGRPPQPLTADAVGNWSIYPHWRPYES